MTLSGKLTRGTQTTATCTAGMVECAVRAEEGKVKITMQGGGIVGVGGEGAN